MRGERSPSQRLSVHVDVRPLGSRQTPRGCAPSPPPPARPGVLRVPGRPDSPALRRSGPGEQGFCSNVGGPGPTPRLAPAGTGPALLSAHTPEGQTRGVSRTVSSSTSQGAWEGAPASRRPLGTRGPRSVCVKRCARALTCGQPSPGVTQNSTAGGRARESHRDDTGSRLRGRPPDPESLTLLRPQKKKAGPEDAASQTAPQTGPPETGSLPPPSTGGHGSLAAPATEAPCVLHASPLAEASG